MTDPRPIEFRRPRPTTEEAERIIACFDGKGFKKPVSHELRRYMLPRLIEATKPYGLRLYGIIRIKR